MKLRAESQSTAQPRRSSPFPFLPPPAPTAHPIFIPLLRPRPRAQEPARTPPRGFGSLSPPSPTLPPGKLSQIFEYGPQEILEGLQARQNWPYKSYEALRDFQSALQRQIGLLEPIEQRLALRRDNFVLSLQGTQVGKEHLEIDRIDW